MQPQLALGTLGLLLTVAATSDVLRRRIPNAVNVAIAVSGLVAQALGGGPSRVAGVFGAAALLFGLLWMPWRRGWLGGGDLKLGVAAALWVGWSGVPVYLLASAVAAGALSAIAYARSGRAARAEVRGNLYIAVVQRAPVDVEASASRGGRVSVPAGAALAAGALTAVLLGG